MKARDVIERIPAMVAFVLVAAVVALLFEIAVASARGRNVDPGVVTGLFALITTCLVTLGGFWIRESSPRPPEPPSEPPPRRHRDHWDEDEPPERPGWLELRSVGRWRPSCSR